MQFRRTVLKKLPPETEWEINNKLYHNRMLCVCGLDVTGLNTVRYTDYVKTVIESFKGVELC